MPSARLLSCSAVLAPQGWVLVDSLPGQSALFGIDRHGLPTTCAVTVRRTDSVGRVAFLGNASAFGAFSEATHLITSDGGAVSADTIIADGDGVRNSSFETHSELPDGCSPATLPDELWTTIADRAATSLGSTIALRRRDAEAAAQELPAIRELFLGRSAYCLLEKAAFAASFEQDWATTVIALGQRWLLSGEEGQLELERGAFLLALWYVSALRSKGDHYRLRYDSLQHTAYVFILPSSDPGAPIERGACAFFAPVTSATIVLEWADGSWNPLSSGFLVASR